MSQQVEIQMNEKGVELLKKYRDQFNMTNRPPGMHFYTSDWRTNAPGTVLIQRGKHSFPIQYVLSVTGSDDPNFANETSLIGISMPALPPAIWWGMRRPDNASLPFFSLCAMPVGYARFV